LEFYLCTGRPILAFPLFGLSELGNVVSHNPRNPNLESAISGARVPYIQLYTSMVKAMVERVPLQVRPNLLTYLLREGYVRSRPKKFGEVWREVDS
jgi:hypothetical protein